MALIGTAFWRRSVLSGEWRDLCIVSYAVDPQKLERYVPEGIALDLLDGRALVSLVALRFVHPRLLGIDATRGEELAQVNLRFYVREGPRRGVVFLCEHASQRIVAWGARALYHEPFRYAPVRVRRSEDDGEIELDYRVCEGASEHRLALRATREAVCSEAGSEPYFFEQRPFGYSHSLFGKGATRYAVSHGRWRTHSVKSHEIAWGFGALYGKDWAELEQATPCSVLVADGSAVHASLPERVVAKAGTSSS